MLFQIILLKMTAKYKTNKLSGVRFSNEHVIRMFYKISDI